MKKVNALKTLISLASMTSLAHIAHAQAPILKGDLVPQSISFVNIAEQDNGEFGTIPAHQSVTIKFKNIGQIAAGYTRQQKCPNEGPDDLFCIYNVESIVKGVKLKTSVYALDSMPYQPGGVYSWTTAAPAGTYTHCSNVSVRIDSNYAAGQKGGNTVYTNDTATLKMFEQGKLCAMIPVPVRD